MTTHLLPSTLDTLEGIPAELLAQVAGAGAGDPKLDVVKSGDNLSAIAQAHGQSLKDIEKWNPQFSKNWNLIHPGDRVIVTDPNADASHYGNNA